MANLHNTSANSSSRKPIRKPIVLVAALLLGACSSEGGGDFASIAALTARTWQGGGEAVAPGDVAAASSEAMGVRLGGGRQVMVTLAGDADGQRLWKSATAKIALITKNGRIVRTGGFGGNLGGYEARDPTVDKDGVKTLHWLADFPDLMLFSIPVACTEHSGGDEIIVILGKSIPTRRIDEQCEDNGKIGWSFKNTFWADTETGFIRRSIQHIHPKLDAIEIESLRSPL